MCPWLISTIEALVSSSVKWKNSVFGDLRGGSPRQVKGPMPGAWWRTVPEAKGQVRAQQVGRLGT